MILVLVIIGTFLVVINVKAILKEKNSFDKKYSSAKENISDFEIELGKLRNEFAETLVEIQSELEYIKTKMNPNDMDDTQHTQYPPVNPSNIKIEQVNKMLREGLTVDDIAMELQLGKGEVILIKELYQK